MGFPMAKAKVVNDKDGVTVIFTGDKTSTPEPTVGIIKFPGGHVEVSRCSDETYWAHLAVDSPENIISSRIDYDFEGANAAEIQIPSIPLENKIQKIALRIDGPYLQAGERNR